jgi:hypothetical protein
MKIKAILASTATVVLLLGLSGCGSDSDDTKASSGSSNSSSNSSSDTPAAPKVDRTTLPWNDDVPADFPLEDVPLPTEGTFDYAKLVEPKVWNVMISDIPNSVQDAWVEAISKQFNRQGDALTFIGKAPSGKAYAVYATIFDKTDSTVTVAYRIST